MSFLAWIDFDQSDRERTHRIMDLFREEDSRDELGIGSIRDALSDLMFPGTSTIQTRLRYMFFVPWIYAQASALQGSPAARGEFARAQEIALISALERGGETNGVIGNRARETLKRLPSDVYWAGLGALGIRRFQGSRNAYMEIHAGNATANPRVWAPGLPAASDTFLETTTFRLTSEEADFFTDRIRAEASESLLLELVQGGESGACDQIWIHPHRADWSPANRELVDHAQRFSVALNGAALLYNLMLAERAAVGAEAGNSEWHELTETYRSQLEDWQTVALEVKLGAWDLGKLWSLCDRSSFRVTPPTSRFVSEWREAVLSARVQIANDPAARQIVERRETGLKGPKSRFTNPASLARWGGASGTAPLGYRWSVVSGHLEDIAHAA